MWHIIERFFLHFVSATFITAAFFWVLSYWSRNNKKVERWISPLDTHLLVTSALLVAALFPLREPYDVAFGTQVWYKAITDQLSWYLGAAVSAWGLYRFKKS